MKRSNKNKSLTYKNRQALGKAVQRSLRSLPKDPSKRNHVIHNIAQLFDVIPKSIDKHKREQRSLPVEFKKAVIQFYNRDGISYQMPGKRDYIIIEDDDGQRTT